VHPATAGVVHGGRDGRTDDRTGSETSRADPPSGITVSPLQGNTAKCAVTRLHLLSQANRRYAFRFFSVGLVVGMAKLADLSFVTTSPLISLHYAIAIIFLSFFVA
jgi:hypothetical protein